MATFNDSVTKLNTDIDNLHELLARLKKQRQQEISPVVIVSAPVVENIKSNVAIVSASATAFPIMETKITIPKYGSSKFVELNTNQQEFVLAVINIVRKNDGINMANITNPTFDGIPFPKDDFPKKIKLGDVIHDYTTLVRNGDNIYLPREKHNVKKTHVKTLKSVAEFNNDFAKAINEVREEKYGEGWNNIIPQDAPLEVSIEEVLNELVDLDQYEINENDPCQSLNKSRFLIDKKIGTVSIIPIDA